MTMKSITINLEDKQPAIFTIEPDSCGVTVTESDNNLTVETRIYGSRFFVPRISSNYRKDDYVPKAISAAVEANGNENSLLQINVQWPNGDWGLLISVGM